MQDPVALTIPLPECIHHLTDELRCYLLVDGAQQPALYNTLVRCGCTLSSLLHGAQGDAKPVSPYLMQLPETLPSWLQTLLSEQLLHRTHLSFVTSTASSSDLARHLTWLTDVVHEDGTEWVNRYFDVRILPLWLNILTEDQRELALAPITEWTYLTPEYEWKIVQGGRQTALSDISEPLGQTEKQAAALLDACVPHMVLTQIQQDRPFVLSRIPVQQQHKTILEQLQTARKFGLSKMSDLKTFTLLSMEYGPAIHQAPPLQAVLNSEKACQFTSAVGQFTSDDWKLLQKAASASTSKG